MKILTERGAVDIEQRNGRQLCGECPYATLPKIGPHYSGRRIKADELPSCNVFQIHLRVRIDIQLTHDVSGRKPRKYAIALGMRCEQCFAAEKMFEQYGRLAE